MAVQVKQQEVSIKKATFSTGDHSTPTPGRRYISKDQQLHHQEGLASCHIKELACGHIKKD
jgi:hypothetical protein